MSKFDFGLTRTFHALRLFPSLYGRFHNRPVHLPQLHLRQPGRKQPPQARHKIHYHVTSQKYLIFITKVLHRIPIYTPILHPTVNSGEVMK